MADGSTIDLTHVQVVFGGHLAVEHPKGTIISIAYNDDQVKLLEGIDTNNFIDNKNLAAIVTVNLMQASPTNDVYTGFFLQNFLTPGGVAKKLIVKDLNGTSLYVAARSKITKHPDAAWSDSGELRAWTILCTRLIPFTGGIPPTPVL